MYDIPKSIPIKKIIVETPHVKTFVFEYKLGSRPGQFVNLWLPRVDEKPMSIAYDNGKEFWVTMFAVGNFSKRMHHLKVGDLVGVRGPYGNGFSGPGGGVKAKVNANASVNVNAKASAAGGVAATTAAPLNGSFKKGQRLVMMAGGYGAAPLYFLTTQVIEQGCTVDFVIGARSKEHLLYIDRIKKLMKRYGRRLNLHIATDDGSVGLKGFNVLILKKLIEEQKEGGVVSRRLDSSRRGGSSYSPWRNTRINCVYGCGPELMLKSISNICHEAKIPAQISIERYMKCGFGVCGQCCVDPTGERMCMEGPVVDNERACKIAEFGKYHRDAQGKMHKF